MRHGSLFSGIGGFDLAAEWMGWTNMFHCEWNQFGQKVLKHYWPDAISYDDICKTDFTIWRGRIDILTGGFPCQPYSMAGKRQGTEDSRHLWPEMLRAIRECRPTWIVGENVPGLINWSGGLVFEQVCADLEGEGYEVQPVVLPASGVNAPHRRDRVWFVANSVNGGHSAGRTTITEKNRIQGIGREAMESWEFDRASFSRPTQNPNEDGRSYNERKEESSIGRFGNIGAGDNERVRADNEQTRFATKDDPRKWAEKFGAIPNDNGIIRGEGCKTGRNEQPRYGEGWEESNSRRGDANTKCQGLEGRYIERLESGNAARLFNKTDWTDWPTVAPLCSGNDGLSERLDSITFPKWRNESIKAGGNAIVPQVALQIFKVIDQMNRN